MNITTISARVMRSYDYSHFEITLGATLDPDDEHLPCTDNLRKEAARLADKAVSQYKIAKANALRLQGEGYDHERAHQRADAIRKIEESDRTVSQQAELKAFDDTTFERSSRFDYEDDWDQDAEAV